MVRLQASRSSKVKPARTHQVNRSDRSTAKQADLDVGEARLNRTSEHLRVYRMLRQLMGIL